MMYIKSLTAGNGNNFVLFEAEDIQVKEKLPDLESKFKDKDLPIGKGINSDNSFKYDLLGLFKEPYYSEENIKTTFHKDVMKHISDPIECLRGTFNIIYYTDPKTGENKIFIPCHTTYIVNEKGATISTVK